MENTTKNAPENTKEKSVIMKILIGLKDYLTDWKNLLGHSLLGVGLLVIAIWAPVPTWSKLIFFACLVTFNIWRMRRKKQSQSEETIDAPAEPVAEA